MTDLSEKVKTALQETRMLILGAQVLLGFEFRAALEKGFEQLPRTSQYLKMGSLGLLVVTLTLLLMPGAHHRIVEEGEDTERMHRFTTLIAGVVLFPFALALGLDVYVAVDKVLGHGAGIAAGAGAGLAALTFWYGIEAVHRSSHRRERERVEMNEDEKQEPAGTPLDKKIEQVLTEARVVLPGVQALFGFQLAGMLVEGFDKLPASSKSVHVASLLLLALAMVLLVTPAAYHRLVEQGEDTEHFHRFASGMVLAAMVPLALGVSGDIFVVLRKVTESDGAALIAAGASLALMIGLWFGLMLLLRSRRSRRSAVPTDTQRREVVARR